jgi:signal transduction histidine kinase
MRHRSIRLRVGTLIAIPMACLVVVYAFAASLTLSNAETHDQASEVANLLDAQVGDFQKATATEFTYALLSLAAPADQLFTHLLTNQEVATSRTLSRLEATYRSQTVTEDATGTELAAIHAMVRQAAGLSRIRRAVAGNALTKRAALGDYAAIIESSNRVLGTLIIAQASAQMVTQAQDLLNLDRADEAAAEENALLLADQVQGRFPNIDRITIATLATTRRQLVDIWLPSLASNYRGGFSKYLTRKVGNAMTAAESTVIDTSWRAGAPPAAVVQARTVFTDYAEASDNALTAAGSEIEHTLTEQARTTVVEVTLVIGLGLIVIMGSIGLSGFVGRGMVRQLRELRGSALTLATDELPRAMAQLRAGEAVDLDKYQPATAPTTSEIEQVEIAFGMVQRVALQAAVYEAQVRRGVSDVFRNLAGRSQSLLHRQLTLLDAMERRASEPEQLEDLFRIDHLTTRMRRHAEGLIILSGETPARGWRHPVPLVDVLRAAVAEIEDYTRIRVMCRTGASVAGHAAADIIHLLAELAENATVFSPPNTPVRMQGDIVGRGFAVEIEDRGLGISTARLEEINANLASPPPFDLSGSDRLGLFIAGQLARRHDIKVSLRPSVYGGTTAVVLIPMELVVAERAIGSGEGTPAGEEDGPEYGRIGRHAALTAIPSGNGHSAKSDVDSPSPAGPPERAQSGGFNFGRLTPRAADSAGFRFGRLTPPDVDSGEYGLGRPTPRAADSAGFRFGRLTPPDVDSGEYGLGRPTPREAGSDDHRPGSSTQPFRLAVPVGDVDHAGRGAAAAEAAELGLPVRVRQANLAPQLRDAPADGPSFVTGGFTVPVIGTPAADTIAEESADTDVTKLAAPPASPEAARAMVTALQRGWLLGRAEARPGSSDETTERPAPDRADPADQAHDAEHDDS